MKLKENKGSMSAGTDKKTLDGLTKEKLEKLKNKVLNGKYE